MTNPWEEDWGYSEEEEDSSSPWEQDWGYADDEEDELLSSLDEPIAEEEPEKGRLNILGGIKDIGKLLYDIPAQTKGSIAGLLEEEDPYATHDWRDKWREAATGRTKQRLSELTDEQKKERLATLPIIGDITRKDIAETSGSTGFSLASMGASLAGGLAGSPLGGYGAIPAGMAAGGTAAYRMDKNMVTVQLLEQVNNALVEERGTPMTDDERKELLASTDKLRSTHALWEAGPEAVGNALALTGLGKIFTGVSKRFIPKVVGGLTMTLGGELSTETVTEKGQGKAEVGLGMREQEPTWSEAFSDVAAPTALLTGLMGGGAAVGGQIARASDQFVGKLKEKAGEKASNLRAQVEESESSPFSTVDQVITEEETKKEADTLEQLADLPVPEQTFTMHDVQRENAKARGIGDWLEARLGDTGKEELLNDFAQQGEEEIQQGSVKARRAAFKQLQEELKAKNLSELEQNLVGRVTPETSELARQSEKPIELSNSLLDRVEKNIAKGNTARAKELLAEVNKVVENAADKGETMIAADGPVTERAVDRSMQESEYGKVRKRVAELSRRVEPQEVAAKSETQAIEKFDAKGFSPGTPEYDAAFEEYTAKVEKQRRESDRQKTRQRNTEAVDTRNKWRGHVINWFNSAKNGDRITTDIEGEVYEVVEKKVVRKTGTFTSKALVLKNGFGAGRDKIIIEYRDGKPVNVPRTDITIDDETGASQPETNTEDTAASLGKLLEDGVAKQEQAPAESIPGPTEGEKSPDVSQEDMIATAARWQGAARKVDESLGDNKKARLRHSRMTTKGDLDAYLMKRYGIDEAAAREISNTLTRDNIPANTTADIAEFKDEAWAKPDVPSVQTESSEKAASAKGEFNPLGILRGEVEVPQAEPDTDERLSAVIDSEVERLTAEIADWEGRQYKKSKKVVSAGGTVDDFNSTLTTAGAVNERRRRNNIQWREKAITELQDAKKRLETGDRKEIFEELLDSESTDVVKFAEAQLKQEAADDSQKEGRLPRSEREGKEPGRPVQEHEAGTGATQAGRVSQAEEKPIKQGDVSVGDTVYYTDVRDESKRLPGKNAGRKKKTGRKRDVISEEGGTYEIQRRNNAVVRDDSGGSRVQLQLFTNAEESKNQEKFIESYPAKIGTFYSDYETIENYTQAAQLLSPIAARAQEVFAAVVLDKNKKPIAVLQHSTGTPTQNQIATGHFLGSIHNLKGADSVWLTHNHPSGRTKSSGADAKMTRVLDNGLRGTGVSLNGHIILTPTGDAALISNFGDVEFKFTPPQGKDYKVKVTERRLQGEQSELLEDMQITSSGEAAEAIVKYSDGKTGILFLDSGHRPIRFLPVSRSAIGSLRSGAKKGLAAKLYRFIDKKNSATTAIVNIQGGTAGEHVASGQNIVNFFSQAGVTVLDVFADGESLADQGVVSQMKQTGAVNEFQFFSQGKPLPPSAQANVRQELLAKHGLGIKALLKSKLLNIITLEEAQGMLGVAESVHYSADRTIEGFTARVNGQIQSYLIQGGIKKGQAHTVLMHELGSHLYLEQKFQGKQWEAIVTRAKRIEQGDTATAKALQEARKRIPDATPTEHIDSELLAYYIGNQANARQSLYRKIIAYIKQALIDLGVSARILTPQDLSVIAESGLQKMMREGMETEIATGEVAPVFSQGMKDVRFSEAEENSSLSTDRFSSFAERVDPRWRDRWERCVYTWLDWDDPKRLVQNRYGEQPEATNYLAAERLRGKKEAAEVEKFHREELSPLLKFLATSKLEISDLEEYAYAKHVQEANDRLKKVNARRELLTLISFTTGKEQEELRFKLEELDAELEIDSRQEGYLDLLDEEFAKIPEKRRQLEAEKTALDNREWTAAEEEKGTPDRLYRQNEKRFERLEGIVRQKESWDNRKDRLSGITNEEAAEIITKWEGDSRFAKIESARQKLADINQKKLDTLFEAGELTEEQYDSITNMYKFYVPLYREGYEEEGLPARGRTTGPIGKPLQVRAGSLRGVVDILAHSVANRQAAIIRKHRLESGQKLYNLVRENPGAEWWIEESKKEPTFDQGGNITYYPSIKEPANGVHVKIDGKRYTIMVDNHDKTMMRMIKSIKEANVGMGPIIEMLGKVSRLLAALNTSFSPEFMITNFVRDIQTAGINLEDSVAKGAQAAIGKNVLSAVRGIYRTERGKESEWTEIYRDFEDNGGKIGWMQSYETIEDLASQLESEMKTYGDGHTLRKNLVALKELVQSGNTAIENGVRLSTYKYLVDHGVSKQRAAVTASNLTVDFTRRGAAGQNLNALYMFANAGIQGNVRMIKAAVRSAKVRKLLGGIIGTGYALHFLALMSGGDDDDGIPFIDKVEDSEKERSMIIMLKDGKKVKIPMPYGYNIFFNLGDELAEMTHHLLIGKEYSPLQGMARLGSVFMNSFNPLSSATLLQTIMPTVGDPIAMVAENKTWYGGDLMPEKNPFGIAKPDSERYWKSASFASREIASRLNALTGGDKVKPGKIDVSPETLDLMVDTYTGSAGRFVKNTLMLPFKALEGDLSSRNVPFIRTVFGTQFEGTDANIYRRNADRVLTLKAQVKAAEGERRRQLMQSKEYRLVKITDAYEKRLKKLYSHLRLLESKGIKDERVDKIKEAIRKRQKRYNQQFNMVISQ